MPAVFEHSGLRFEYPDNWSLETDDLLDGLLEGGTEVMVTSPSGAFWSVSLYPKESDLHSLLNSALQGMREEYSDLDAEPAESVTDSQPLVGYDANFYCLDLTNTAQIRGFQGNRATYLFLWQAEDHDFETFEPVFLAMTTSLLRGLSN